ncbi:aspartate kinase [Sulfoacidibacillus thermotolerans]|uniref:Aspartokinase n=1 Tax=Sulfoacidibacillus thermotolerans TaxID=1765684 RepID=A0A2U3DAB9_SULT2|nr:aspartate kinase [Sulfoacidibacillus thermotolerans]PWI58230.1 aspartate kinase [Sulfoacidibacillus thermotolerans]
MKVIVQKFGGTSVSSRPMREKAIMHIEAAMQEGYSVVVVVSAMGRIGEPYATDTLLNLIASEDIVSARDQDLLMSCGETISAVIFGAMLRGRGHEVTVLTGGQAGIATTSDFGNARIAKIDPERIMKELEQNRIVVVTGFQGMTREGETTTLGRGGSDTSATALGVALDAEFVDIFTDVDGIMTADPNIVQDARRLTHLTYTEIANFASQGAKVIHPRAVELAMQKNIPIRVRSTESNDPGTLVTSGVHFLEARPANDKILTGVTHSKNLTQIKVRSHAAQTGFQNLVFRSMAENGISVDFFNVTPEEVVYTVPNTHVKQAVAALHALDLEVQTIPNVAKVAAVGAGIHGVPGVMARIVEALTEEKIEILQSADSNTTIWCLVHENDMVKALRAIHDKFNL